jgi:hypothetical protein
LREVDRACVRQARDDLAREVLLHCSGANSRTKR